MRRLGVLLFGILFLMTACLPYQETGDPAMRALAAQAEQTGTARAVAIRNQAATVTAEVAMDRSQRAIDQAMQRLAIEQTSQAISEARASSTAAVATLQAGLATSTSQAISGAATQTAVSLEVQARIRQDAIARERDEFLSWFVPVSIFVSAIALGGALIYFLWLLLPDILVWIDRRQSIRESRYGVAIWRYDPDSDQVIPHYNSFGIVMHKDPELNRPRQLLDQDARPSAWDIGKSVSISRPENQTTQALAIRLMQDACQVEPPSSNRIPGHRELSGWLPERWQRVVNALKTAGIAQREGNAIRLVDGYCLDRLYAELYAHKIHLRPSPSPCPGSEDEQT